MKKKFLVLFIVAALVCTYFATISVSAAETFKLDITPAALKKVNGAEAIAEENAESGPTWHKVGAWKLWQGLPPDYLMPFAIDSRLSNVDATIVLMNYGNYILIAKDFDFSKYSSVTITYSSDRPALAGHEIGFLSEAVAFGGGDNNAYPKVTDGRLIVSAPLSSGTADLNAPRTVTIDLSNVDYKGDVFISHYMATTDAIVVTDITFTLAESSNPDTGDTTLAVLGSLIIVALMAAVVYKRSVFAR